jgi:galactonate dehydratase
MSMPLETYPYFSDANDYVQVLKNPPEKAVEKGMLKVPTSPGLGAEIDLEAIAPFRTFDYRRDAV